MMNPITNKQLEEDRLTLLTQLELEAVTEVEAMEEYCLLTCSPELAQSALLYCPDLPAQGWYHPHWAESSRINHYYSQ